MPPPTPLHCCLSSPRTRQRLLLGVGPNVGELMLLCEENYRRLMQLVPTLPGLTGDLLSHRAGHTDLALAVIAQAPYTTTLRLTHLFSPAAERHPPLPVGDRQPHLQADRQSGAAGAPVVHAPPAGPTTGGTLAEPNALLRAYHDAGQVEVLDLRQTVLPLYRHYGAPALEAKWRANLFLSKWLAYCVRAGHGFSAGSPGRDSQRHRELLSTS